METQKTEITRCSYCQHVAKFIGDGQDGDSYCEEHVTRAPGTVSPR